jgi:hypothetical protein
MSGGSFGGPMRGDAAPLCDAPRGGTNEIRAVAAFTFDQS